MDFWLGLAVIPALLAVGLILWILYSFATWCWEKIHVALLSKVELAKNRVNPFGEDKDPEFLDSANLIRDALLKSPRVRIARGLGWYVLIVRDHK